MKRYVNFLRRPGRLLPSIWTTYTPDRHTPNALVELCRDALAVMDCKHRGDHHGAWFIHRTTSDPFTMEIYLRDYERLHASYNEPVDVFVARQRTALNAIAA